MYTAVLPTVFRVQNAVHTLHSLDCIYAAFMASVSVCRSKETRLRDIYPLRAGPPKAICSTEAAADRVPAAAAAAEIPLNTQVEAEFAAAPRAPLPILQMRRCSTCSTPAVSIGWVLLLLKLR